MRRVICGLKASGEDRQQVSQADPQLAQPGLARWLPDLLVSTRQSAFRFRGLVVEREDGGHLWTREAVGRQAQSMQIQEVALTVTGLAAAARFYHDVFDLPVAEQPGQVTVTIGSSRLVLEEGDQFAGAHHLAIGIAPADFEVARGWLSRRVEPIAVDGSEVIEGPEGWDSRSVYFLGPEDIVLEFIARDADSSAPAGDGRVPRPLSLSEVGIGVPSVPEAVRALTGELGLPTFPPQGAQFAPVGDHDGLIILVDQNRIWFPTDAQQAARGPVTVKLAAPRAARLSLRESGTVVAVG